jgi:hypothetical protein
LPSLKRSAYKKKKMLSKSPLPHHQILASSGWLILYGRLLVAEARHRIARTNLKRRRSIAVHAAWVVNAEQN